MVIVVVVEVVIVIQKVIDMSSVNGSANKIKLK